MVFGSKQTDIPPGMVPIFPVKSVLLRLYHLLINWDNTISHAFTEVTRCTSSSSVLETHGLEQSA